MDADAGGGMRPQDPAGGARPPGGRWEVETGASVQDDAAEAWLSEGQSGVDATNVDSQGIAAVLYSKRGGVLQVRLGNGCAYCYRGVPSRTHKGLLKSKSKEKYLRRIRKEYGEIEIDRPGIREVCIQNFRSIRDRTVRLGDLTVLIGANGTGKTSVLDALDLFLSKAPNVTEEDYCGKSTRIDITVTVNPGAHSVKREFLRDGKVRLRRSFTRDGTEDGRAIRAEKRHNRDFGNGRDGLSAAELKKLATRICREYPGAPAYKNRVQYLEALARYELELSQDPKYADRYDTEFAEYGASRDGDGLEGVMGSLIFAPAMRNIEGDGREGTDSLLTYLLDRDVRGERGDAVLQAVRARMDEAHDEYKAAVASRLKGLGRKLKVRSRHYMEGARFRIDLDRPRRRASHPEAHVRMRDNGHMSLVGDAGSGFQRVYLLSMLDLIASMKRGGKGGAGAGVAAQSPRLIVIDEPELYQHPQRQRRILRNLIKIVKGDPFVRIVCSTHSPYFVELQRVDTLRLLRRVERTRSVTLESLMGPMLGEKRSRSPGGREDLTTWLDMNATHWITEGFFARLVAIVEGPGDRNMLLATASAIGVSLESREISIAPADGVESLPKFMQMFAAFGIPAYPVWDLDHIHYGNRPGVQKRNRLIIELACGIEQWKSPYGTIINSDFSCFKGSLTESLAEDLYGCEALLEGSGEYRSLKEAREKDVRAAQNRNQQLAKRDAPPRGRVGKGNVMEFQKRFLNSKLHVFKMLRAVRAGCPERLEKFDAVRVVRMLDALGKGARAHARKGTAP